MADVLVGVLADGMPAWAKCPRCGELTHYGDMVLEIEDGEWVVGGCAGCYESPYYEADADGETTP